jgi:hypothetical protein
MTRVATAANEAELLDLARCSTAAQLERICRFYSQARRQAGQDPRVVEDERRWVVSRPTEDGMVSIQIRLLPDEAARLMRAIEIGADHGSLADGAVALAETMLSGSAGANTRAGSSGVDARAGSSGADTLARGASVEAPGEEARACRVPIRPPVEVVVHVTAANLQGTTDAGDGLSAETCRRLLCDAGVVPMLEDASGTTIDVGRKTRAVPAALRRALRARDRTCRFPGCTHSRGLDAHHARHWIDGGETRLSNVFHCCRRHHRYLHEYGFTAEMRAGELVFLDPDGHQIPPMVTRAPLPDGSVGRLRARIQQHGIEISAETNAPGWDGLPVDYDACVNAIGGWDPM